MQSLQNEIESYFAAYRRPYVIASWGMSLDGKTVTHPQDDRQISSLESVNHCHQLRHQVDAILIGANTAIRDDPQLTARPIVAAGKQPIRIIVSSSGKLPARLKVFQHPMPAKTWIVTADSQCQPIDKHIEVLGVRQTKDGKVDISALLDELGKRDIKCILVEGGMTLLESFFAKNFVNKVNVYLSPFIIGTLAKKHLLKNVSFSVLGNDCLFNADY